MSPSVGPCSASRGIYVRNSNVKCINTLQLSRSNEFFLNRTSGMEILLASSFFQFFQAVSKGELLMKVV